MRAKNIHLKEEVEVYLHPLVFNLLVDLGQGEGEGEGEGEGPTLASMLRSVILAMHQPMAGHLKRIDLPMSALAGALIESWLSVCRHM